MVQIAPLPPSPSGEISHGQAREKINETLDASNNIRPVYGTLAITQRDTGDPLPNVIVVAAHPGGTDVLNPPSAPVVAGPGPFGGFYRVTAFIPEGAAKEIITSGDEMTVPNDGVYIVPIAWAGFRHSVNGSTVGFVIGIERAGNLIFSQRPTSSKEPNGGDLENISGGGQAVLQAGDKVSAWVSSDNAGNITIGNANFTMYMLDDTTP